MDSDDEYDSEVSEQLEERESDEETTMAEMLRDDDPTITSVHFNIPQDILYCHDDFLETTSALQDNRIVDQIRCDFGDLFVGHPDDYENVDLSPLLDVIRTRSQLRTLILHDWNRSDDISPFLFAAAENPALESLFLHDMVTFSAESLERFQSHPNLSTIFVSMFSFHDNPAILESLKQVIKTCPRLDSVYLQGFGNHLVTGDSWRPIGQALCKVQPKLTLVLRSLIFDAEATILLQDFLHQSPTSVYLRMISTSFLPLLESSSSSSSWLPRLLGPSVRALAVCYSEKDLQAEQTIDSRCQEIKLEVKEVMKCLNEWEGRNIKELEFVLSDSEPENCYDILQTVFDGIPDILFVTEFTLYYSTISCFSDEFLQQHDPFSFLKKKLLDALAKNISIQKMNLVITRCTRNILDWTNTETEQLEFLRLRNESISQFMASPKSSPLSVWPHFFQAVQATGARLYLVFQGLRANVDILPVLCVDTDSTSDPHELEQSLQQQI
jgi:hypothetical protein